MKLNLATNLGAKLSLPCPFVLTVVINVLELSALNAEFQYFIPLFYKIS
jgi:hypothetical protein